MVPFVDIVITVKTDIKYVRSCVNSLIRHAPDPRMLQQRIIFVDDGSPASTITYVKWSRTHSSVPQLMAKRRATLGQWKKECIMWHPPIKDNTKNQLQWCY